MLGGAVDILNLKQLPQATKKEYYAKHDKEQSNLVNFFSFNSSIICLYISTDDWWIPISFKVKFKRLTYHHYIPWLSIIKIQEQHGKIRKKNYAHLKFRVKQRHNNYKLEIKFYKVMRVFVCLCLIYREQEQNSKASCTLFI